MYIMQVSQSFSCSDHIYMYRMQFMTFWGPAGI